MRFLHLLSTLAVLSLSLANCSEEAAEALAPAEYSLATVAYKAIGGVDPNLLSLDVYHFGQAADLKPVVVYVHGGAWAYGDKANSLDNKKRLFFSLGYVFASINYRLSPASQDLDPGRIMFPTHNEDVADAVKWISDSIANYGGDSQKIVLLGHSAGAHLVSLTGTSGRFLPARGLPLAALKGVASIDTEGYDVAAQVNSGNSFYINAFGTDLEDLEAASPIAQLSPGGAYPKFFIAKRGTAARMASANDFIAKLESVGVEVSQVTASQYDHEGINEAIGAPNETAVTEPLKAFLARCFE